MSSQYGEHIAILKHFEGRGGRFLDVGAFDGVSLSNTRPLFEAGWSGVLVEPSPLAFVMLLRNYWQETRVDLIPAAVVADANESGLVPFWINSADGELTDMLSSVSPEHVAKCSEYHPFSKWPCYVAGINWQQLFESVGHSFDFVNIDTEGTNFEVLAEMPITPEMLCYEWDRELDGDKPRKLLEERGYTGFAEIGGNLLA
jgi:FkbM family methyltransferase